MKILSTFVIVTAALLGMGSVQAASGTTWLLSSPVFSRDSQDHANLDVWIDPEAAGSTFIVTPSVIDTYGKELPVIGISCGPYVDLTGKNFTLLPGMPCHLTVSIKAAQYGYPVIARLKVFSDVSTNIKKYVRAGLDARSAGENSLIHAELR